MKNSLLPIKFKLNEWSGAIGDIGTLAPIFLSLVALNGLPPVRSLLLISVFYITSALFFRIPMPIQPLKAMAAIAIAQGVGMAEFATAGFLIGIILLILAFTGKIGWLTKYFTQPIVKGIQLGVGLMLIKASFKLITNISIPSVSLTNSLLFEANGTAEFLSISLILVASQLPLTLGNAVFAASDVANNYFYKNADRATPKKLAISLGLSNIVIGILGGLPVCHGSGGLTAHYRFGARTAGATIIMGGLCLLFALAFANQLNVFNLIPVQLLGIMLFYVGVCHVSLIKGLKEKRMVAFTMGIIGLLTGNLAYSLGYGLIIEVVGKLRFALNEVK